MSLSLDSDLFNWLISLGLLKTSNSIEAKNNDNISNDHKNQLDPAITEEFATGVIISKIIEKLMKLQSNNQNYDQQIILKMDSLKNTTTPASKLYNWNIICDILKKFQIIIDQDVKSLIVAGDLDLINEVLREIFKLYNSYLSNNTKNNDKSKNLNNSNNKALKFLTASPNLKDNSNQKSKNSKMSPEKSKDVSSIVDLANNSSVKKSRILSDSKMDMSVDITKIDSNKDLNQTQSVLEFMIVSISKHLSLTPKQAASLMTDGNKYLAHVIVKGIKGIFEPIIFWYQDIYANSNHLLNLAQRDKPIHKLNFILSIMKPGFLSKNSEISQWTCTIFSKFAFDFANRGLLQYAWEWFISENGGLHACILCLRRHFDLIKNIVNVLEQYARYNLAELFTIYIKNICFDDKDYLCILNQLINPLIETHQDELTNSGVINAWIDYSLKAAEQDPNHQKNTIIPALSFICELWIICPSKIESQESVPAEIIGLLKKATREKNITTAYTAITLLFRLFEEFIKIKNNLVSTVYKAITFSLIENFSNQNLREYILRNLKQILDIYQEIPINIIFEPLIKQLQIAERIIMNLNIFDYEFLLIGANNDKLNLKLVLKLVDILAKIYLNNIAFAPLLMSGIINMMNTHIEVEHMQEFIIKFIKITLAMFFTSEKSKRLYPENKPKYNNQTIFQKPPPTNRDLERDVLASQKRALSIEILKHIITLNNENINEQAKNIILYTHYQIKQYTKRENKGILMLIGLFGNPNEILNEFEKNLQKQKVNGNSQVYGSISETDRPSLDYLRKSNESAPTGIIAKPISGEQSSVQEGEDFLNNLESRLKERALKQSKRYAKSNPRSTTNQPDSRVLEEIILIKQRYKNKIQSALRYEEEQREKELLSKKKLRNELEKRNIEYDIGACNKADIKTGIINDFDSYSVDKKNNTNITDIIDVIDINNEEDRDKEGIWIIMRRYNKVLKMLFNQYTNTAYITNPIIGLKDLSFNKKQDKSVNIYIAELWKMIVDHDYKKYITKDQMIVLIRLINNKLMNRVELQCLDYDGFNHFIIQLSILLITKSKKNLYDMPLYVTLQEFFNHFRDAEYRQGKNTILYDDPDSTEMEDKEYNKLLNENLRVNNDYILPENYKKVTEKNLDMIYMMPSTIKNIDEKYILCAGIIDELLAKAFGVHIFEPMTMFNTISKAKLKNKNMKILQNNYVVPIESSTNNNPVDSARRDQDKQQKQDSPTREYISSSLDRPRIQKRKTITSSNKPILSLSLKSGVAKASHQDRLLVLEVAEVLQEMIDAVYYGKTTLDNGNQSHILNKAIEIRLKQKEEAEKEREELDRRRKLRAQEVKQQLEDLKKKEIEKEAQKKEAELKRLENEKLEKEKEEKKRNMAAKLKENLLDMKKKKKEEEEQKKKEEMTKKEEEKEEKRKAFEQFNNEKLKKYKEEFENKKALREQEEKERKEAELKEKQLEKERKKNIQIQLEKDKKRQEKQRKNDEEIKTLTESQEMQTLFKKSDKSLRTVYSHYINLSQQHLESRSLDFLPYKGWMLFCSEFMIFPSLLELPQVQLIFVSLTRNKPKEDGVLPVGITYDEFKESLVRISIKRKDICDQIYKKGSKLDNKDDIKQQINKEKDSGTVEDTNGNANIDNPINYEENTIDKNKEDNYNKISETRVTTVEGLFIFLDLPTEKQALLDKLNYLHLNSQHIPPKKKKEAWINKLKQLDESKDVQKPNKSNNEVINQVKDVSPTKTKIENSSNNVDTPNKKLVKKNSKTLL